MSSFSSHISNDSQRTPIESLIANAAVFLTVLAMQLQAGCSFSGKLDSEIPLRTVAATKDLSLRLDERSNQCFTGDKISPAVFLVNESSKSLFLFEAMGTCGCTKISLGGKSLLEPGERRKIELQIDTFGKYGPSEPFFINVTYSVGSIDAPKNVLGGNIRCNISRGVFVESDSVVLEKSGNSDTVELPLYSDTKAIADLKELRITTERTDVDYKVLPAKMRTSESLVHSLGHLEISLRGSASSIEHVVFSVSSPVREQPFLIDVYVREGEVSKYSWSPKELRVKRDEKSKRLVFRLDDNATVPMRVEVPDGWKSLSNTIGQLVFWEFVASNEAQSGVAIFSTDNGEIARVPLYLVD